MSGIRKDLEVSKPDLYTVLTSEASIPEIHTVLASTEEVVKRGRSGSLVARKELVQVPILEDVDYEAKDESTGGVEADPLGEEASAAWEDPGVT
jgi:hypothetical protein